MQSGYWLIKTYLTSRKRCGQSFNLILTMLRRGGNTPRKYSPNDTPYTITILSCRFDLWEEISSSSFFTTAVQHRSLREGATLAAAIGQMGSVDGYNTQAANLLCS